MTLPQHTSEKIDLKSAQQLLEAFYDGYSTEKVKLVLLEAFQGYALNNRKGFLELGISEQEVCEVFDGLIELVGAVRVLMDWGKIEGLGPET
ncbi:hypothetical protein OC25_23780 [Pedobacter kyungheensis]|uniref:Uncharacterized protein n=1 Tax=Pedobacter kyungheensis TaxID=1069985 RepID=A0A0C1FGI1_9SPHI|nr:hypothetical protein [Pedobacter kyungheensis]KIA90923.1 hypothetical protein OC25_23780 [Pedobacter kyungheensis]